MNLDHELSLVSYLLPNRSHELLDLAGKVFVGDTERIKFDANVACLHCATRGFCVLLGCAAPPVPAVGIGGQVFFGSATEQLENGLAADLA
jgi:hypothetical protein